MSNLLQVTKLALYSMYLHGAVLNVNGIELKMSSVGVKLCNVREGWTKRLFWHQMDDKLISDYWSILRNALCQSITIYYKPYKLLKDMNNSLNARYVETTYDTEIGVRILGYSTVCGRNYMIVPYDNCDIACDYSSDTYEKKITGYDKRFIRLAEGNTVSCVPEESFGKYGTICIFYPDSMDITTVMEELTHGTPVRLDKPTLEGICERHSVWIVARS